MVFKAISHPILLIFIILTGIIIQATNTFTNYFTFHFKTGKFNHQLLAGYDYIGSKVDLDQKYYEDKDNFGEGSGIVGTFSLKNPKYIARPTNKYDLSDYESQASDVEASVYHTQGIYVQEQISINKWKLLIGLRQEMYQAGDDDDKPIAQMRMKQMFFFREWDWFMN